MTIAELFAWLLKPTSDALSIEEAAALRAKAVVHAIERQASLLRHAIGNDTFNALRATEHEAASLATDASNEVQTVEKEIMALPQNITDALAAISAEIQAGLNQKQADASTIAGLNQQVSDLTTKANDLQTQLTDAQSQLTELLNAVLALVPAPASAPAA